DELRAAALCRLAAEGTPARARRACERLHRRLAECQPHSGHAAACTVVLLLGRGPAQGQHPCRGAAERRGSSALAMRALHRAGEAPSSHSASTIFQRPAMVDDELPAGAFPSLREDAGLFAEPDPEEPAGQPQGFAPAARPQGLSRWFGQPRRPAAEVLFELPGAGELEPQLEPEVEPPGAQDSAAAEPRAPPARLPDCRRLRLRRQAAWEQRGSWDARWEATRGGLSLLQPLWLSCASRVQERALWEHPHGLGLLSCLGEDGRGWVRAAGLALRGVPSDFFEVAGGGPSTAGAAGGGGPPGLCAWRVVFRAAG
ncbi:unnamed protein product, partial [Prorocentrum cordatum]